MAQLPLNNLVQNGTIRANLVAMFTEIYAAIATFVTSSQVGAANGVAPLDGTGKVPLANLPSLGGGSTTLAGLTDIASYDLGTNNTSVTAIKTTANGAIPASQKGAANGVATLGAGSKVPQAQMTGVLALADLTDGTSSLAAKAAKSQTFTFTKSFFVPSPVDGVVAAWLDEEGITITKVSAITATGTTTLTTSIAGTNLTGTAVSASATYAAQNYSAGNVSAGAGAKIAITASGSASPVNLEITVTYTRTFTLN